MTNPAVLRALLAMDAHIRAPTAPMAAPSHFVEAGCRLT